MTDQPKPRLNLSQRPDLKLRAQLLARIQSVQLLKMSEPEVANLLKDIEADPLFQKLLYTSDTRWKVIRFQANARTRLSGSFYEMNEQTLPEGASSEVGGFLDENREAIEAIRKIGAEKFEKYFLMVDQALGIEEAAAACGVTVKQAEKIKSFLLSYSIKADVFSPSTLTGSRGRSITCLGRLGLSSDGEIVFEVVSPHLARGRYDIHYDRLKDLIANPEISPEERRHLKALIRRLELMNWRQNNLFRMLDFLTFTQRDYLTTRDTLKRKPITQRQLARRLSVSPSTVSRAISGRSLVLPWGEERLLDELFCSRKTLCLDALDAVESTDGDFEKRTDIELQEAVRGRLGISVPRRTVNTYRRALSDLRSAPKKKA